MSNECEERFKGSLYVLIGGNNTAVCDKLIKRPKFKLFENVTTQE